MNLSPGMKFVSQKEHFFANENNNQAFISLVGEKLMNNGYTVYYADGDADVDIVCAAVGDADVKIVCAAVSSSEYATTTIIGQHTNLQILLYHAKESRFRLYYLCDTIRVTFSNPVYDILNIQ